MARAGLFDDVDVAFTWHPWSHNEACNATMLATCQVFFKFVGKSSHASGSPHLGRSALDAVELMNVGANYLREHLTQDARLHYAVVNPGGRSPNVVQAEAEVLYKLRAPKMGEVREILDRVVEIARGAALMTGTEMSRQFDAASADMIPNVTLSSLMHRKFQEIGVPAYSEEEVAFAKRIQDTFSEDERKALVAKGGKVIADEIDPFSAEPTFLAGSSDVGDVSWIVPTAQVNVATWAFGTPGHSWQIVSQGKSSIAHKGMLLAGKVMAASAIDVMRNPSLIDEAKVEHATQLSGETYQSLIPAETVPRPISRFQPV